MIFKNNNTINLFITLSLLLTMSSFSIALTSTQVLMDEIIKEFSLLGANQGMTNSMFNFGSFIAVVALVFIKGRISKSTMLSMSAIAMAISMFFIGYSALFFLVLIFFLFSGTFGGWIDAYTNSMVMDINKENSSAYIGALHGSYALGAVLTPRARHFLMIKFDWRDTHTILSFLTAIAAFQFIIITRILKKKINSSIIPERRLSMSEIKQFAGDKYNLLLIIACFFYSAAQVGHVSWLVRYMNVNFPDLGVLAQFTVSMYWLGVFICRMTYTFIKINPLKIIMFSLCAPAIAHTIGVLSNNGHIFIIAMVISGLTGGMAMPLLVNESLSRYKGNTSMALSGLYIFAKIGMVAMPAIMGTFAAYSLNFSMLLTDMSFICSALIIWAAMSVKKRHGLVKRIFFRLGII